MERKRIIIKGKVKDVGYRLFLYENADAMDISEFYAKNIKDGVEVLVGGKDAGKFADFTRKDFPDRAEVLEVTVEDYDVKIRSIERFAQSFMLSQMGKFVNIGLGMSGKQDSMLENQDKTQEAIQTMDDHMGEKFDWLGDRYGEFGQRMARLEEDIHEMKDAANEIKDAFVRWVNHVTGEAK